MIRLFKPKKTAAKGFTLIEILIISPIILIITIGAVTFLFNEYGGLVKQSGQLNLQLEAQDILFGLQDDLWYANQFASDLNANLQDDWAPTGGWTASSTPPTLIISTAALTKNHRDPNRQPVYINESTCTPPDGDGVNSILYNNVIYYVSGTNLYKRIVSAPSSLPTCGSSFQKQSCPTVHTTSTCLADALLSDHVNSFEVVYYDTNNGVVTTPEQAESVKVTVNLTDKAFGENITASSSLRIRKLNQ